MMIIILNQAQIVNLSRVTDLADRAARLSAQQGAQCHAIGIADLTGDLIDAGLRALEGAPSQVTPQDPELH